jgi:hypothetical protein
LKLNRREAPCITSCEGAGLGKDLLTFPAANESNESAELVRVVDDPNDGQGLFKPSAPLSLSLPALLRFVCLSQAHSSVRPLLLYRASLSSRVGLRSSLPLSDTELGAVGDEGRCCHSSWTLVLFPIIGCAWSFSCKALGKFEDNNEPKEFRRGLTRSDFFDRLLASLSCSCGDGVDFSEQIDGRITGCRVSLTDGEETRRSTDRDCTGSW